MYMLCMEYIPFGHMYRYIPNINKIDLFAGPTPYTLHLSLQEIFFMGTNILFTTRFICMYFAYKFIVKYN